MRRPLLFCCVLSLATAEPRTAQAGDLAGWTLFGKPGEMIPVGKGSRLSLYCVGSGSPTIVLETGFGGGTALTWHKLQPLLGSVTRTCSYDRAGYGFSELGNNLPRDLEHMVEDLGAMLARSGEKPPYVLVGHSNGGYVTSVYAKLHPRQIAGLIFLDAAVSLPEDVQAAGARKEPVSDGLQSRLDRLRRCLERSRKKDAGPISGPGNECVDTHHYSALPGPAAAVEISNRSKPDYWRAYLSEAESNYKGLISGQARKYLPHKWENIPVRVFIASITSLPDKDAAKAFGIDAGGRGALQEARANRARWEKRQARLCDLASDCQVFRIPTHEHMVHNAALETVMEQIRVLVLNVRLAPPQQARPPELSPRATAPTPPQ